MNRKALFLFGACLLIPTTFASEWTSYIEDNFESFADDDVIQPRFINFTSSGSFITVNKTLVLFSGGIILWGIAGAMLLYYLLTVPAIGSGFSYDYDSGYGGDTGGTNQGGYSKRSDRRSYSPYGAIDWEHFSILDWIAVAEETWRNFEPANLDCQKRLICELHQNVVKFGAIAKRMVDAFSYLEYAQVLRLPDEMKYMIDEYMEAADRGRSQTKDCGEVYSGCDFSVKKIMDKLTVTDNEI